MVRRLENADGHRFACTECGLVYRESGLAEACQRHCETHESCNLAIGRQAIGSLPDVP